MNILVCIKRVPDTTAKIKIASNNKFIDPQGVEFVINPYDEIAIEEALKLKEKTGQGEVVVISIDADGNETILRKALAMGADKGILIKTDVNFDGHATADVLANAIKDIKFDIIFFGKQAVDDDSSQVPSIVASLLNIPRVNVVNKLEINGTKIKAHRQIEGGEEVYELEMPAIISAQKGLNEPRYPSLKGIMAAKKKPIDTKEAQTIKQTIEIIKMDYPPQRPAGRIVGKGVEAVPELIKLLKEEAKIL